MYPATTSCTPHPTPTTASCTPHLTPTTASCTPHPTPTTTSCTPHPTPTTTSCTPHPTPTTTSCTPHSSPPPTLRRHLPRPSVPRQTTLTCRSSMTCHTTLPKRRSTWWADGRRRYSSTARDPHEPSPHTTPSSLWTTRLDWGRLVWPARPNSPPPPRALCSSKEATVLAMTVILLASVSKQSKANDCILFEIFAIYIYIAKI